MATKVFRMEADCEPIIRKYAIEGSLTDGIRAMEMRIHELEMMTRVTPAGSFVPAGSVTSVPEATSAWFPVLEEGMSPAYWKRLKTEVEAVVKIYAGER